MRALTIVPRADGDGDLTVTDRPVPEPGPDQVRVRVHGAGLNRADLLQRAGRYPPPPGVPADIPGMEFGGIVEAVGSSVASPAPGTPVYGIVGGGAQAEMLVVRADQCCPVPEGLDPLTAGGIAEAYITAHDALRTGASLEPGDRVLVHAAGSGVGTAVIQLARAFDCEIVGTARSQDKLDRARALGLDHGILVPPASPTSPLDPSALAARITAAAGPIDVVIDLVGGDYVAADIEVAAVRGRIVLVGTLAGASTTLPILSVMGKRLTLVGTVLRGRTLDEKAITSQAYSSEVADWWTDGTLQPVVERVIPLAEADAAYELLASDATFGKVVLDTR